MLQEIISKKSLTLKGIVGLYPANRFFFFIDIIFYTDFGSIYYLKLFFSINGEDVEVYTDESRSQVAATFCMLRQQAEKEDDKPYFSQADFIAPKGIILHLQT